MLKRIIRENLRNSWMLNESRGEVNFNGNKYGLIVDVTESPTKQSVRIKFKPLSAVNARIEDVRVQLQQKLNEILSKSGLMVDNDTDTLDENEIGFLISVNSIKAIITQGFGQNVESTESEPDDTNDI